MSGCLAAHQPPKWRRESACGVWGAKVSKCRGACEQALACVRHFLRYLEGVSIAAVYFLISLGWGQGVLYFRSRCIKSRTFLHRPHTDHVCEKSERRGENIPSPLRYCCLTFLSVRTVTRLPPLTDLELLSPRAGVELELALLRFGERLEREAALSLLAQRAQLEVIGGVERCGDRHVEVDQLEKLPP